MRNVILFSVMCILLAVSFHPVWSQDGDKASQEDNQKKQSDADEDDEESSGNSLWDWMRKRSPQEFNNEEIVVIASRLRGEGLSRGRMASNVSVIEGEDIRASHVLTITDYLQRELGVVKQDSTGNGRDVTIELRGFTEGQNTVVMVDGVVQNRSDNGSVNWSTIPIENIERVEILRGPSSTVAGRGASGGVINIMTKRGGGAPTISAGVEVGEHQYQKYWTANSGSWKNVRWASHSVREFGSTEQDHSDFRRTGTWQRIGIDGKQWSFDVTHTSENSLFQQPSSKTRPEISISRTGARKDRPDYNELNLHQIQGEFFWQVADSLSLTVHGNTRDQDSRGVLHFAGGGLDTRVNEESWGTAIQVQHVWSNEWADNVLTFGGDYSEWEFDTISRSTDAAGNWAVSAFNPVPGVVSDERTLEQEISGFYINDNLKLWDRLTLSAGFREDKSKIDFENEFLPAQNRNRTFSKSSVKLGAVLDLPKNLQVFAGWSQGFRIPAVFELFTFGGFQFDDNPELDPEETESWEVGMRWAFRDMLQLEATYYDSEVKDDIQFVATGPFSGQNQNTGTISQKGFELSAKAKLTENWNLWTNWTNSRAFFKGGSFPKGNQVPLVPEYTFAMGTTLHAFKYWTWSTDYTWISDRIMSSDQAHAGPRWGSYGTANTQVEFSHKGLRVWTSVTNLFDEKHEVWAIWNAFSVPAQPFYVVGPERNVRFGLSYTYSF